MFKFKINLIVYFTLNIWYIYCLYMCVYIYIQSDIESILEFTITMMTVATTEMATCLQKPPPIQL